MQAVFIKGLIIGFIIAVPIGPTGLLCISRGLYGGSGYGLLSWLGVATGDALAGYVAALGLTLVSNFFLERYAWLHVLVGLFFCYFGIRILITSAAQPVSIVGESKLLRGYTSTLFLTVTNPATFASVFAMYAGWGVKILKHEYLSATLLAVAIFIGTVVWWLAIGAMLSFCRDGLGKSVISTIHAVSGTAITAVGIVFLVWV
jgi:threonine/homoserine/homoserine lactone efflux protein